MDPSNGSEKELFLPKSSVKRIMKLNEAVCAM